MNILEPRAIVASDTTDGICGKNYFIPDYQRGYRWEKEHVNKLLHGLTVFFRNRKPNAGNFYCLQPIVVKKLTDTKKTEFELPNPNEDWYEVIDGQQRLTTIRIILAIMKNLERRWSDEYSFNIHYRTRPALGAIFDKLSVKDTANGSEAIFEGIDLSHPDIDTYHVRQTAQTILDFFPPTGNNNINEKFFTGEFEQYFLNDGNDSDSKAVKVIWYELTDNEEDSAEELFERINEKCIKLNNAELVRALFLSDQAEYKTDETLLKGLDDTLRVKIEERESNRKQSHIITQWDVIEQHLHDPSFWAFINQDGEGASYDCRIEYLFDLVARKDKFEGDSLFTLLELERRSKLGSDGLWELWRTVERYAATLSAWSRNRNLFHKIGFIVLYSGRQALIDLLEKSTTLPKKAKEGEESFESVIDGMIKDIVAIGNDRTLEQLDYYKDSEAIKKLLTLYNVESTRLKTTESFFPFDRFKEKIHSGNGWSLEHIHAQNSELIDKNKREKWVEFIELNLRTLRNMKRRFQEGQYDPQSTIDTLEAQLQQARTENFSYNDVVILYEAVVHYFNRFVAEEKRAVDLHSISNLALLSAEMNSSAGKSVFEVKRQLIIEKDAAGEYIPVCTRRVFLKYYNSGDEDFTTAQQFFWGKEDQRNYAQDITTTLSPYLK